VIERDGSRGQGGLDIPARCIRLIASEESLRCREIAAVSAQFDVVWLLFVADDDEARGLARDLRRLGDHGGDELPMIGDGV
jgi:hypothetical protein